MSDTHSDNTSEKSVKEIEMLEEQTTAPVPLSKTPNIHSSLFSQGDEEERPPKKHPNLFNLFLFRRSVKQIMKGRKGSLNVEDIGEMPSNLDIDGSYGRLLKLWDKESQKKSPSLIKVVIQREFWTILFSFIAICISQTAMLAFPVLLIFIVRWVNSNEPKIWLGFVYAIIVLATQLTDSFTFEFCIKWVFTLSLRIRNGLIGLIFNKALKLNSAGIEDTGKLVNLMSNDAQILVEALPSVILGGAAPIMFVCVFIALGIFVRIWCLIPLGVLIVGLILNALFGQGIGKFYGKFTFWKDKRLGFFGEIIHNIKFVKYNGWEDSMKTRLDKLRKRELIRLVAFGMFKACLITLMVEIGPFMSFLMFLTMVLNKVELDVETVFACMAIFNSIKLPFQSFGFLIACLTTIKVSLTRILNFLKTPEITPNVNSEDLKQQSASQSEENSPQTVSSNNSIELKDVNFNFPNGETAFSCDELNIQKGELVCVLGSVGSGKSSFVLSLLGELERTAGTSTIRGKTSYASQTAWLMNTTIRENITFLSPYDEEKYNSVVYNSCLTRDLQILKGGDMYEVAERGANLSGGQRQRISIARALYSAQDIVIFDDPLSAVDFQVGSFIFEKAMENYLKNKTRIIVTNQTYFIDKADRIIVIENKKIAFNGSLENLKKSDISASQFVKTVTNKKDTKKKEGEKEETVPQDVGASEMEDELREKGRVSWRVYYKYLKYGGIIFFLLAMIPFAMRIGSMITYNLFLSYWSNGINENNKQGDLKWFYAHLYSFAADFVLMYFTITVMLFYGASSSIHLHQNLIKRILGTKLSFFDVTPIGRIVNYFSRDFHLIDSRIPSQIDQFIGQCCAIISVCVIISIASYYLIIVLVVVFIVFMIFHNFFIRSSIEMQRLEGLTRSPIFIHFDQTLLGLSTVRTSNGQDVFMKALIKKMRNNTLAYYTLQMAKIWYSQRLEWLGFTISTLTVLLIVILKSWFTVDTGFAATALMNVTSIPALVLTFAQNILELEITMQSTERVLELQKIPKEEVPEIANNYEDVPSTWPSSGTIELDDYQFKYRENLPLVLKGVSVHIQDKEKIGIVGRTGSGKSTMMAGLFRIENPAGGRILVDNIDIMKIPLKILRTKMCILPQEATMFSGTIRDNLDPTLKKTEEDMLRVLQLVHVNRKLDDPVTENGENFSLGERQMICMARALLKNAKILIMDEATASIDIQTDIMIQEMVRTNFTECTVLTIAHRLHSIMDATKVMVFDNGKLMENDKPINLIEDKETIFSNLVMQSGCPEELKRLALGQASISETLKSKNDRERMENEQEKNDEETMTNTSEKDILLVKQKDALSDSSSSDKVKDIVIDLDVVKNKKDVQLLALSPLPTDTDVSKKERSNDSSSTSSD
ncbi:multidrug resistance-associated protein, putative [Entamoeba invadens IP1]|uniref:Multidrug resistance-associated protein, putative n=1 Tax=Entamoeba invadens IP1 TaxID=370355 RepID=A0A0A1TZX0_ENTIV|nr:multidrug resistance-associated protein, putative [Entamoeba invadens IP1]ELP85761.1 multidrug resistance-associated protein, putative [Entamoeba invadens IP1]|eukprot:XP_004185107.1 multidrug resistance-associated protein, putative [Entamoeba invadens IP1]